ncbi:uncharacterized protein TRIADDRAFT_58349 [Trichoplax adhaerens]|uniref:Major facilitator superfamily (MFS) profile domain-containing protein n=1 Tax=Trichoplax adhaerens TaxID=10228 RepID=B3S1V2_TRIAD|nr:hypothetical protein TRIADDRAFT_58349 [Trichoplax adhaerens]EDV23257.1 hypothetical protein TRIADDRAFT_58349 [Trichoplax adhaerens]|eukprot:XP_002114167.1 hypothetical protein TRIADDRAFT_58349 [Trichoplax adhaerens]
MDETAKPVSEELDDLFVGSGNTKSRFSIPILRRYVSHIEVVIFLVFLGYGIGNELSTSYPIFYNTLKNSPNASIFTGRNSSYCIPYGLLPKPNITNKPSSQHHELSPVVWIAIVNSVYILPSAFFSIIYSVWSDQYRSRRTFLIMSMTGIFIQIIGYIITIATISSPAGFIVGNVMSGIFGGYPTFIFCCYAYVVDLNSQSSRTSRFVYIQLAQLLTQGIATIVGEQWAKYYGFIPPLALSAVVVALAIFYVWYLLEAPNVKASIYDMKRTREYAADISKNIAFFFKTIFKSRDNKVHYCLIWVIISFVLLSVIGFFETINLYLSGYPYCWSIDKVLIYDCGREIAMGAGAVIGWLLFKGCFTELTIAGIGITFMIMETIMISVTTSSSVLFGSIGVGAIGGVTLPCLLSILSRLVSEDEQGILFCFAGLLQLIIAIIGLPTFLGIFMASRVVNPAMVFIVMTAILVVPKVIVW